MFSFAYLPLRRARDVKALNVIPLYSEEILPFSYWSDLGQGWFVFQEMVISAAQGGHLRR